MREPGRSRAMAVKTGSVPLAEAADLRARAVGALQDDRARLRVEPETARVSAWMVNAHQWHWTRT
jgi:hypothetical protein